MTPTNFAAEQLDPYASSNWHGVFATEQGPIFNHSPEKVGVTYGRVISGAALSLSETSGVDDWMPPCELNFQVTMTAQQFYDELKKGTDVVGIQPLALAKHLGKEKLVGPYASSNWHGVFATKQGPIFTHSPEEVGVTHHGTDFCHVISKTALSLSETDDVGGWN